MTELNMRRIGLRLVFAVALSLLFVSSVRQQWNSKSHTLTRELDLTESSNSNSDEGIEQFVLVNRSSENGYIKERVNESESADEEQTVDGEQIVDETQIVDAEERVNESERTDEEQRVDRTQRVDELQIVDENQSLAKADGVDTALNRNIFQQYYKDGNIDNVSTADAELNNSQYERLGGGTVEAVQNKEDDADFEEKTLNAAIEKIEEDSQSSLSSFYGELFLNRTEKTLQTVDMNNVNIGGSKSGYDLNWRSTKYANALYSEEGDDDNYKIDDSRESYSNVKENNIVDKSDNQEQSMFWWLPLKKYLTFGNSPENKDQGEEEIHNESNSSDDQLVNDAIIQNDILKVNTSFQENEENNTGEFDEVDNSVFKNVIENYNLDTNQNIGNVFTKLKNEVENEVQREETSSIDVNGIDKADYDDFEDFSQNNYNTLKDDIEKEDQLASPISLSTSLDTRDIGAHRLENADPAIQNLLTRLRLWEQDKEAVHLGETQDDNLEDSHILHTTQHYQQQAQPLRYQQQIEPLRYQEQEIPMLPQLPPQKHQGILQTLMTPRLLDLLLSDNAESSYLRQFPAELKYFIHQNIHRIDQDFDPLTNKETKQVTNGQTNILDSQTVRMSGPLLSAIIPMNSLKTANTEHHDNFESKEIAKFFSDEDDNFGNDDNIYEDENNNNKGQDNNNNADDNNTRQNNIYTTPHDTAIYDNPRPLSEQDFALFRTRPYNNEVVTNSHDSIQDADNTYDNNNDYMVEEDLFPQKMSRSGTEHEDETLPCPRDAEPSDISHPVTALVAFSDSSSVWVKSILEQLTGIATDSIYNIMAQLKMGNVASVYEMGKKIAIETHIASDKNFEKAIVLIRNPFSVDAQHKTFRPSSVDWQNSVLWNQTYSSWLTSNLPMHVMTYEDLVESPLTELIKLTDFLSSPEMKISYKCAMNVALDPPSVISDVNQIAGIYHDDRRRINQNIDHIIQIAQRTHPDIVSRLYSYKVSSTDRN